MKFEIFQKYLSQPHSSKFGGRVSVARLKLSLFKGSSWGLLIVRVAERPLQYT